MASAEARLEPEDSLSIRDTFHLEMNQQEIVRPDGPISAMLMGEVPVAGWRLQSSQSFWSNRLLTVCVDPR
jgi:hypothetical protein